MSYSRVHSGGGFAARRPTKSPQHLRQDWTQAVDLAKACAIAAERPDDAKAATAGDIARLMAVLRDLKHDNFPVGSWSARQMAAAFLTLAQSFVRPEMGPEARTACAGFLGAGAATLDNLLTALRTADANATWRRQTGERDDD